jgi:hypothetical protein
MELRPGLVASVTPITSVVLHYVQMLTESNPINKTD